MLVVPNQGEQILLDAATGKTPATPWTLRLFINDITPSAADTEAAYVEASGGGYAGLDLTAGDWATTPGAPTLSAYPQQVITFTGALSGGASVFGYYLTDQSGRLIYVERLESPFTPLHNGDHLQIALQVTFASVRQD